MDKPKELTRREFLSHSFGLGIWALLLYPFIKYQAAADKPKPQKVSQHPASWYKRLAG